MVPGHHWAGTFYHNEFSKYKNDIRKTWDTLKEIINKKTFKSDFSSCFVQEGVEITGSKIIADKFNEYFTEIGPKLARSIDAANKVLIKFLPYHPLRSLI